MFLLFDKDQNGVLSLAELGTAMKTLGQRLAGDKEGSEISNIIGTIFVEEDLLLMVREVSQDKTNNTIEFNEFLKMMAKQEEKEVPEKELTEAFK